MPFRIIRDDITRVKADAIVNTANPQPIIGSGTDTAVYRAAGEQKLLAARKEIGPIEPGDTAYTPAFKLKAKYILHTVGPVWIDGSHGEREILHSCYEKSLVLAAELECESIAFPLMSTGSYGFPKDEALQIALAEINKFLLQHEMLVTLVVFDKKAFELSSKLMGEIEAFIDENLVRELRENEYAYGSSSRGRRSYEAEDERRRRINNRRRKDAAYYSLKEMQVEEAASCFSEEAEADSSEMPMPPLANMAPPAPAMYSAPSLASAEKSLDDLLSEEEDTFQQRLFKLIDKSGMTDVNVYKKANVDRKLFSKIRSNENYKPKKETAIALAIALELDMPAMQDLLSRAGLALSPGSKFDLIITYFVTHHIYDIFEINAVLFEYNQPCLGM